MGNVEHLPFDTLSLFVAAAALFASLVALLLSWRQLHEATTSNGGRGMNISVKHISREDVSPEDAVKIDGALEEMRHEYVPFMVSFEVTGPAEYYQVIPYTWGKDGVSDRTGLEEPIPKLTCEDRRVSVVSMIQKELIDGIRFGVAWLQPDGVGLKPGAIRFDLNGDLEEWVWRNRFVSKLPFVNPGRWKPRKTPKPSVGPLTQPWELRQARRLSFIGKKRLQ